MVANSRNPDQHVLTTRAPSVLHQRTSESKSLQSSPVLSIAAASLWPTTCAASLRFRRKRQSGDQTRSGWQRCKLRLREHCEAAHCGAGDTCSLAWSACLADQSAAVTLVQL
jgi:hypothetical protein